MAKYVKWFKAISKTDVATVGGKASNLGEMFNAGFPVPTGFVVLAGTYKQFIAKTGISKKIEAKLKDLDIEDSEKLQAIAKEVQELILSQKISSDIREEIIAAYSMLNMSEDLKGVKIAEELVKVGRDPVLVAVRSSATAEDLPQASFAGQQASFLNVKGNQDLIKAVKSCWASLFTARAIYYRVKNNFPHMKVAIAVVIQKMINSEKSGVMFSINPTTNNKDQIVIEAAFGLGEAVVSGSVNPNTYIIDKNTQKLIEKDIPGQDFKIVRNLNTGKNEKVALTDEEKKIQVLNGAEITALTQLAKKVESHYNFPQDIEWAIERNKVFLVQTRPVTTLKKKEDVPETKIEAESILKGLGASPGVGSGSVRILQSAHELDRLQKGEVLVAKMTNPDFVPAMQRAAAIVTDEGGLTCHAAIVSREMGVPCVVGTKEATQKLKDGDKITVDGTKGLVYLGKVDVADEKPEEKKELQLISKKLVTATEIYVIMDLPQFAQRAAETGADGIGLLRLEGIIASGKIHPAKYLKDEKLQDYTNLLVDGITKIATPFKDKIVWVRTSDLRTDEYRGLVGGEEEPKEPNPMIGWHGIRRSLSQPELLKAEFKALKKVHEAGLQKVGVMLPFVVSVDEIEQAKEICRQAGMEPRKDIEFGVMIETPASVFIIEELCKEGIDFISLGTNDLTQTVLGVDRNNEKLANLYNWNHPAVKKAIKKAIEVCKENRIHTSICGQAGSDPKFVPFLIECGIDSVSANPDAVAEIKKLVYDTEKKLLIDAASSQETQSESNNSAVPTDVGTEHSEA